MTQRRRWSAVFAAFLAFLVVALGSSPASAGEQFANFKSPFSTNLVVTYYIFADPTSGVTGRIDYPNGITSGGSLATLLSVYVVQCDGLGHNCSTIAANMTQVLGSTTIRTSAKPYSFGHVWKTCGSVTDTDGWRLINACTAFTT
jgi:hypothetical protein